MINCFITEWKLIISYRTESIFCRSFSLYIPYQYDWVAHATLLLLRLRLRLRLLSVIFMKHPFYVCFSVCIIFFLHFSCAISFSHFFTVICFIFISPIILNLLVNASVLYDCKSVTSIGGCNKHQPCINNLLLFISVLKFLFLIEI